MAVPTSRIHRLNSHEPRSRGSFVLYWMIGQRRLTRNFALDRAIEHAKERKLPLLILEGLNRSYRWAAPRFHQFVIDGMEQHAATLADRNVTYYPFVEREDQPSRGMIEAVAEDAAIVVTDDFPCFEIPHWTRAAAKRIDTLVEAVDSNGLYPMRLADRDFPTAHSFRRHLQKVLRPHFDELPREHPCSRLQLPTLKKLGAWSKRWPAWSFDEPLPSLSGTVGTVALRGGREGAVEQLDRFMQTFDTYDSLRNHPDESVTSGLSPYLHFGHLSSHEIFLRIAKDQEWCPDRCSSITNGSRAGWWRMSTAAEAFLDQLITWRELGYNMCALRPDYDQYASLPAWAQKTLDEHRGDKRPHLYSLEQFAHSETHDRLWNAAQTQLRDEGVMHNYLRMVWGKKILEWSKTPEEALDVMIELNNRYAMDGRNPNSYSGIFWVLGRYDRAWGPERPIYGKVRYMTLANTARKVRLKGYLERYGDSGRLF